MIENESLRATNIHMLNDPNELVYGLNYVKSWFNSDISKKIECKSQKASDNGFSAFVFSLSELGDDMHQWDKYGNNHEGIRIGFTPEDFLNY